LENGFKYHLTEKEGIMKRSFFKGIFFTTLFVLSAFTWTQAQEPSTMKLPEPVKKGGLTIMEAFSKRASERSWADKELSSQDLSNLLWAGNGINRPDIKKRTAPSAMNAQDVDIYVIMKSGAYLYDAFNHALNLVSEGDHRSEVAMSMGGPKPSDRTPATSSAAAPVRPMPAASIILVSDLSKFRMGTDESKKEIGIIDSALVSENISVFCAGNGLTNVPRASINKDALKVLLKLKDTQYIVLENAVGYPTETR
jgi:nitroreductase